MTTIYMCANCADDKGKDPCYLYVPNGCSVAPARCPFHDGRAKFKVTTSKAILEGLNMKMEDIPMAVKSLLEEVFDAKVELHRIGLGDDAHVTDEEWSSMDEELLSDEDQLAKERKEEEEEGQ